MKELWLIGADVEHSPSARMHNAGLAAMGLPMLYKNKSVAAADLDALLDEAAAKCRGLNVTAPYKTDLMDRYRSVLDEDTAQVGALNTVVFDGGRATAAHNTDVLGLETAWRRAATSVQGRDVCVYGTGGAARAALYALYVQGAKAVSVVGRTPGHVEPLLNWAQAHGLTVLDEPSPETYLLVIAASGLDDPGAVIEQCLSRPGVVHDLRYRNVAGVRDAALHRKHLFIDGTSMLLAQAQAALRLFVGRPLSDAARIAMGRALTALPRT